MGLDTRELFARLIQCEAGGEGLEGMQAVATVIMNRATTYEGEFSRVNNGGDVRAIITQPGQFVCMLPQFFRNSQCIFISFSLWVSPDITHLSYPDRALLSYQLSNKRESLRKTQPAFLCYETMNKSL